MAEQPQQDQGVDNHSIKPSEQREALARHLQTRPEEQDLKNRHILLDTTAAPALQAKALELERQRVTDSLKKGLANRPEKEILVERKFIASSIYVITMTWSDIC